MSDDGKQEGCDSLEVTGESLPQLEVLPCLRCKIFGQDTRKAQKPESGPEKAHP